MYTMCNPTFLLFMATVVALVLLVLVIFSTPFIQSLYFLRSDIAGGIEFGLFGFCNELRQICTPKELGYHHEPQLIDHLTTILVLYPVAAALALLGALVLVLIMCLRSDGGPLFVLAALLLTFAFLASAAAFAITMYLFTIAMERFHDQGYSASYGPSVWLGLAATAVLLVAALNAGCGTCMGGRFGRQARHRFYSY